MHFQDNLKVLDRGEEPSALAHETGLNQYIRTESPRATAAIDWWEKNHQPWNGIREFWISAGEKAGESFAYTTSIDGTVLSEKMQQLVNSNPAPAEIETALAPYIIAK